MNTDQIWDRYVDSRQELATLTARLEVAKYENARLQSEIERLESTILKAEQTQGEKPNGQANFSF